MCRRRIRVEVQLKRKTDGTAKQETDLVEQRSKLSRNIARFRTLQATYTPTALQVLAERPAAIPGDGDSAPLVENIPLCLPSSLSTTEHASGVREGLFNMEEQLRDAQMRTSLDRLRNQLHIKSRLLTYRGTNVRHQGATTRSRALMFRNDIKIRLYAEKYQAAWQAKLRLCDGDLERVGWHPLDLNKDIRCMEEEEDVERENQRRESRGEGRRQISWIWMGADSRGAVGLQDGKS